MAPSVELRASSSMTNDDRRGAFGSIGSPPSRDSQVEFPSLGNTAQQPYKPRTAPWGSNLWGTNTVFAPSQQNGIDEEEDTSEKKGSAALLSSQDKRGWGTAVGSRWELNKAITIPRANSPGISPARTYTQPSTHHGLNGHAQSKPSLFPSSRTSSNQTTLDPSTNAFYGRSDDTFSNSFGNSRFGESDATSDRNGDQSTSPWTDAPPLQSPTDDRRSVANGDFYSSSRAPSRSDSLPPSRRGPDGNMYPSRQDTFPQVGQFPGANRLNGSSTFGPQPHSRYNERSSSIQSEAALPNFHRMQLAEEANEQERGYSHHRPSASVSGIQYAGRNSSFGNAARDTVYENGPTFRREESQSSYRSGTPEDLTNGQYMDQQPHLNYQSNGRQNLAASQFDTRHSSYLGTPTYSNGAATPAYDPLNPSRGADQSRASSRQGNFQPALLQQRLQHHASPGFPDVRQFQAAQQTYLPQQFYRSQLNPYQQSYPQPSFMPAMSSMNPMAPPAMEYYPRGPRALSTTDSTRSATLEDFKANSKGTKKWELRELYGHVVEFSGDQHGSRFIQQKLEGANSDEKAKVFAELLDNAQQLMKDVYGNYVIQKFFEHGDQGQKRKLADCMTGNVYELSQQTYGCRVVQKALEFVLVDQQAALVKELEPHVLDCVKHQQGNHVIQKAIERVPAVHIQFIIDALKGSVVQLSSHSYGCRVIQRLLEHKDPAVKASVMAELHDSSSELITHQYGNYVAQHIIKEGGPDDRNKLIGQITSNLVYYSKHKLASNVVEVALHEGTIEQRRVMMSKVIESNEKGETPLYGLIKDAYANYVIQKLLQVLSDEDGFTFYNCLEPEMEQAKKSVPVKNTQAIEKEMDANKERFMKAASALEPANSTSAATTPPPLEHDVSSLQSSQSPSANGSAAGDAHVSTNDSKTTGEDQSVAIGSQNGVLEAEAQS